MSRQWLWVHYIDFFNDGDRLGAFLDGIGFCSALLIDDLSNRHVG